MVSALYPTPYYIIEYTSIKLSAGVQIRGWYKLPLPQLFDLASGIGGGITRLGVGGEIDFESRSHSPISFSLPYPIAISPIVIIFSLALFHTLNYPSRVSSTLSPSFIHLFSLLLSLIVPPTDIHLKGSSLFSWSACSWHILRHSFCNIVLSNRTFHPVRDCISQLHFYSLTHFILQPIFFSLPVSFGYIINKQVKNCDSIKVKLRFISTWNVTRIH